MDKEEILKVLKDSQSQDMEVLVLSTEDAAIVKTLVSERKAYNIIFTKTRIIAGGVALILVSWGTISGKFLEWIKNGLG